MLTCHPDKFKSRMFPSKIVNLSFFLSQAVRARTERFAPWTARFARADRIDKARPRRWFCWDLSAFAVRKKAACSVRARTRPAPCSRAAPGMTTGLAFSPRLRRCRPWGAGLGCRLGRPLGNVPPGRSGPNPRKFFEKNLTKNFTRLRRGRAFASLSGAAFSRRSVARIAQREHPH